MFVFSQLCFINDWNLQLSYCYFYFYPWYDFIMNVRLNILNCTCRTLGKLPLPSGSCPWPRLKGTWKTFLHTNRPFHSDVSVVVLGGQLKPRIDTQMDKEGGQSSQQSLSWICWRMQRVMLKSKVWMLMLYMFHISKSIKHRSKDAEHTEPMEESTLTCHLLATLSWFYPKRKRQFRKSRRPSWQQARRGLKL